MISVTRVLTAWEEPLACRVPLAAHSFSPGLRGAQPGLGPVCDGCSSTCQVGPPYSGEEYPGLLSLYVPEQQGAWADSEPTLCHTGGEVQVLCGQRRDASWPLGVPHLKPHEVLSTQCCSP